MNATCIKCLGVKPLNETNFYWRNDSGKWRNECKNCWTQRKRSDTSITSKIYYEEHKEELLAKNKEYRDSHKEEISLKRKEKYKANREKIIEKQKAYAANNKEKVRAYKKEYHNERYSSDLVYKLNHDISTKINKLIHGRNSHVFDYTYHELIAHLESLFEPWMNWGNRGVYSKNWDDNDPSTWTWQIDHIIPQSDLPYTSVSDTNFKKCWALENLRPLSSKQNLLDGVRRVRHKRAA